MGQFLTWGPLLTILCLAAGLRLLDLERIGVIYMDDLRAYSGLALNEALRAPGSWIDRVALAYAACIQGAAARPGLVLLMAVSSLAVSPAFGLLCVPFALAGVLNVFLVWVICHRCFGAAIAHWAALWLAVNAAHVNFSRSVLPPTPAITFILLGALLLCPKRGSALSPGGRRLLAIGICFALATAFHPAYLIFLVVPGLAVVVHLWQRRSRHSPFPRKAMTSSALLVMPVAAMIVIPDAIIAGNGLLDGTFERSDLRYLTELKRLFTEPSIRGNQEGLSFLPRFLYAAHGMLGSGLALAFVAGGLSSRTFRENPWPAIIMVIWVSVPWGILSGWPNLNSYGRLYAPLLPGVACLAGVGAHAAVSAIAGRSAVIYRRCATAITAFLVLLAGLPVALAIVDTPGRDPAVASNLRDNHIESLIALERTDFRAFPGMKFCKAFSPTEIERCRCGAETDLLELSPSAFYLVVRHQEALRALQLEPVFAYSNPYRLELRAMEGFTASERDEIVRTPLLRQLGLFRITRPRNCAG